MITSVEEFIRLRTSDHPEDYNRAAHDEAPPEVWCALLDGYPEMREWVAHNKTITNDLIRRLAKDPSPRVRHVVAMKRKTPPDILQELSLDPDDGIRLAIARHPRAPLEALRSLANDPWDQVREIALAKIRSSEK